MSTCYNCSRPAVMSLTLSGVHQGACISCYAMWQFANSNRFKGASMLCHDGCGRPAVLVVSQTYSFPSTRPTSKMRNGAYPLATDIPVCAECADARSLTYMQENHQHHTGQVTPPLTSDLLDRLAGDPDDFTSIPAPSAPPAPRMHINPAVANSPAFAGVPAFWYSTPGRLMCSRCTIEMVQLPSLSLWKCPQCFVQLTDLQVNAAKPIHPSYYSAAQAAAFKKLTCRSCAVEMLPMASTLGWFCPQCGLEVLP